MLGYNQARGLLKIVHPPANIKKPKINMKRFVKTLQILGLSYSLIDFIEMNNLPLTVILAGANPDFDLDLKHHQTEKAFYRHSQKLKEDLKTLLDVIYSANKGLGNKVIVKNRRFVKEIIDELFKRKIITNYAILANEVLKEYFTNDRFDGHRQEKTIFFEFQDPKRYNYLKALKFKDVDLRGFELTGAVRDFLERVR